MELDSVKSSGLISLKFFPVKFLIKKNVLKYEWILFIWVSFKIWIEAKDTP